MKKSTAIMMLLLSGCISQNINVETIEPWEGHYYTVEEFKSKTESIQLDKKQKETVWVLSDRTLSRVLKNVRKEQK